MGAKTPGAKACTFLRRTEPPPRQGTVVPYNPEPLGLLGSVGERIRKREKPRTLETPILKGIRDGSWGD